MKFDKITRFANRSALKIQKHSPQILFYGGLVGVVATTIMASRATLKAQPVIQNHRANRVSLEAQASNGAIDKQRFTEGVVEQYTASAIGLTKLYAPTLLVGAVSIAALTKSHQQLTSRNTALTVAYTGLFKTFEKYRGRVREQLGVDQDQKFMHGEVLTEVEYADKNGKVTTKEIAEVDPLSAASLSHYFDAGTNSWCKDPGYNQSFLDNQQRWANILLQKQGHLFLNEVYDLLQIPKTRDGNILGWVYEDLGNNDTFVTFGHQQDGEFVAGFKRDVMLEFNIHGPVLDLI